MVSHLRTEENAVFVAFTQNATRCKTGVCFVLNHLDYFVLPEKLRVPMFKILWNSKVELVRAPDHAEASILICFDGVNL